MEPHQAPLSLGFSRQEHWSGLPFPSEKWNWKVKVTSLSHVRLFATPINLLFQILIEKPTSIFLRNFLKHYKLKYQTCTELFLHRRQETAGTSHGKPFSVLLAMKVGLLRGLADVEVRALAQHGLLGTGWGCCGLDWRRGGLSCFQAHWPCLGYWCCCYCCSHH